jgi:hypothetical protein
VRLERFDRRGANGSGPLREALARCAAGPGVEARRELHASLRAGPLYLALRELPKDLGEAALTPERPMAVEFVTHEGPDGGRVLAGFSDPEAVAARAPAAVSLSVSPVAVLGWIADAGFCGILLDPGGAQVFVSRDEALEILGRVAPRRQGRSLSLDVEPERRVREALEQLLAEGEHGARLSVQEPRTGKLVTFTRCGAADLLFVVPGDRLSPDERARAGLMFEELTGMAGADDEDGLPPAPVPVEPQALFCGDPGRAARAAVKAFTWIFGFPAGFALEIARSEPKPSEGGLLPGKPAEPARSEPKASEGGLLPG